MRRLLYIALVLSTVGFVGCRKKEEIKPEQADQFVKMYGQLDRNTAGGMVELSDGWVLAGTYKNDNDLDEIFVVKTDLYGNTIWLETYTTYASQRVNAIKKATTGFILAGEAADGSGFLDVLAIKIDDNGAVQWSQTAGIAGSNQSAADVIEASNGEFCLAGYDDRALSSPIHPFNSIAGQKSGYYVTFTPAGAQNLENWKGGGYEDWLTAVVERSPGYLFMGTTYSSTVTTSGTQGADANIGMWGVPLNGSGTWFGDVYGTDDYDDFSQSLIVVSGQEILFCGRSEAPSTGADFDGFVFKSTFSADNTTSPVDWARYYGGALNDEIVGIAAAGSNYAATGYTTTVANAEEHYLLELSSNGAENWSTTFGYTGADLGYRVFPHPSGGYVSQGSTELDGASSVTLIRTDAAGNLNNLTQ